MSAPRLARLALPLLLAAAIGSALASPSGARPAQAAGGRLDRFKAAAPAATEQGLIRTPGRFSGYTNYWHDIAWNRFQSGNLFQMSMPDVEASLAQAKRDVAEELGLAGLDMEEGFLAAYAAQPVRKLEEPGLAALDSALGASAEALFVSAAAGSEAGRRLAAMAPPAAPARTIF